MPPAHHTVLKVTGLASLCFSGAMMEPEPQLALEMASLTLTSHTPLHTSLVKTHRTFCNPFIPSWVTGRAVVISGAL